MIIRSLELETVCGITSTLPENTCGEIKCRKIVIDQWTYESQIICPYIGNAW